MSQCPNCGMNLKPGVARCAKCGSTVEVGPHPHAPPPAMAAPVQPVMAPAPVAYVQYPHQPQVVYVQQAPSPPRSTKSKSTAALLAILLGGIGAHKFYLGQPMQGLIYLLFCLTGIPMIIGFFEGICYLTYSDEKFDRDFPG